MNKWGFIAILFILPLTTLAQSAFRIATVLQSDMVIQQNKPFALWGNAACGDTILLKGDWMKTPAVVIANPKNEWKGCIPVPKAAPGNFTPHTISVVCKNTTIQLNNILIGEVWLCSGQSNMDMELRPFLPWLRGVLDYEKEIAAADYSNIRLINIETDFKASPASECKGKWNICTSKTAPEFSGVAYYFARELYRTLNVPVGLIVPCIGGSSCEAWTSREALESDSVLKRKYLAPFDTGWQARNPVDATVTFEKVVMPTLLFNGMISPVTNFSISGVLWYQGESNKNDKMMYARLGTAMLNDWRKQFGQSDLPFYYVQMTPYNWQTTDSTATWYAMLREAQEAMLTMTNTGMAVTMDVGEPDDIHPRDKKSVGERLAKLALKNTYNKVNIVSEGPRFESYTIENKNVKINFKRASIGSGLSTKDGIPPQHFYLAGPDKVFYKADAKIVGNQVWLTCDKVAWPVAIRYAFTNYPVTNFQNKDGQPAWPFRTDTWDK